MIKWLPTALAANPKLAAKAVLYRMRGFRVRASSLFAAAAARHPDFHDRWTKQSEPALFALWHAAHPSVGQEPPRVGIAVLPEPATDSVAARTAAMATLGAQGLVEMAASPADTLRAAERAGFTWLAVLPASCRVSHRLGEILEALGDPAGCDLVYWDSDHLIAGRRTQPIIKPDWDPILARSHDLLTGSAMIRIAAALPLADALQSADSREAGWAELLNRLAHAKAAKPPLHLPLILTHDTRQPAVAPRIVAAPAHSVKAPGVSIIIPTRDQAELLEACIAGLDQLDYAGPIETLILDNQSCETATSDLFAQLAKRPGTRIVPWHHAFNFAAMMNHAAEIAQHPVLCLLNNDVTPLDGRWLDCLVAEATQPDCGAAGARLLYPDGTIQHVGVALGIGGAAGHVQKGIDPASPHLANWHQATRRVSAVTGACLVVLRERYLAVGGMDAKAFAVDFNDVDLCLKLDRAGWSNRVVTEATLIHHESKTRGKATSAAQKERFARELAALQDRWGTPDYQDPWHSPLFRRESEQCLLRL